MTAFSLVVALPLAVAAIIVRLYQSATGSRFVESPRQQITRPL